MINTLSHRPQLRPITSADLPFLLQVYSSTRVAELNAMGLPAEVQAQFLESQFQMQHRHYQQHYSSAEFHIVTIHEQDVGRLYLVWKMNDLHLIDIALLPDYQQRGIGRILMAELMAQATARNGRLLLRVELNNPVRNWYLKLGFVPGDHDGVYQEMQWLASPESVLLAQ